VLITRLRGKSSWGIFQANDAFVWKGRMEEMLEHQDWGCIGFVEEDTKQMWFQSIMFSRVSERS
jgi:hypothetical protein